jgi:hypothetical protein
LRNRKEGGENMGEIDLDRIEQMVSCLESRKKNPDHECSFCRKVLLRNDETLSGLANFYTLIPKSLKKTLVSVS